MAHTNVTTIKETREVDEHDDWCESEVKLSQEPDFFHGVDVEFFIAFLGIQIEWLSGRGLFHCVEAFDFVVFHDVVCEWLT